MHRPYKVYRSLTTHYNFGQPLTCGCLFCLLRYVEKRSYSNDEFFNIAKSVNNDIVIGCDAHSPHELRNIRAQDEIKQHLKNLGLNVIETVNLKKI